MERIRPIRNGSTMEMEPDWPKLIFLAQVATLVVTLLILLAVVL